MEKKQNNKNEEVDIFELFGYIGRGFHNFGNTVLRFLNFLMRNIIILALLLVIGIVAGYFLDKGAVEMRKTEAIVVSNFESAEYLYKSIHEITFELKIGEPQFLKEMKMTEEEANGLSLEIQPVMVVHEISKEEQTYLEMLKENESLPPEEKQAIINRSFRQHKITLFHPAEVDGRELLRKIIEYIRQSPHFKEVYKTANNHLQQQINSNLFILAQIDTLFQNYSKNIGDVNSTGENLVYSTSLDLGRLLETRAELQTETQRLIIENVENSSFIKIIDMGSPTLTGNNGFLSKKIITIPLLFIFAFFMLHILLRINTKRINLREKEKI